MWVRWTAYVIVGVSSLVCLLMLLLDRRTGTRPAALGGIGFGLVWFTWMLLAPRFYSRRQFRNNPIAQSQISLNISDQGFESHNAHADSRVAWSAYVAWGEAKSVFILMPQPRIYVAIPKRAFTEEQQTEFREILRRNVVAQKK